MRFLIISLILFSGFTSLCQTPYYFAVRKQVTQAALLSRYCDSIRSAQDLELTIARAKIAKQEDLIAGQDSVITNLRNESEAKSFIIQTQGAVLKENEHEIKVLNRRNKIGGLLFIGALIAAVVF